MNFRNSLALALALALVLCSGCSTIPHLYTTRAEDLSSRAIERGHGHRMIRLQFTKEF